MTTAQYYPVVLPPDIEFLAQALLTSALAALPGFDRPVPVVTRLPSPADLQSTLTGTMRVEAANSVWIPGLWGAAYDCSFLLHAYSPNEDQAAAISRHAIAQCSAVQGTTVMGWWIVNVLSIVGGQRLSDPDAPQGIVRYRSVCTWRVAGQPLS